MQITIDGNVDELTKLSLALAKQGACLSPPEKVTQKKTTSKYNTVLEARDVLEAIKELLEEGRPLRILIVNYNQLKVYKFSGVTVDDGVEVYNFNTGVSSLLDLSYGKWLLVCWPARI